MTHRVALLFGSILMAVSPVSAAAPSRQVEAPAGRRPELWAIVVGIDSYIDPRIIDGKTAVDSAFQVHDWFVKQAGWDRSHVLLMVDLGAENPGTVDSPSFPIRPIRKNLDWAFDSWLKEKARPGDLVAVYFAGRSRGVVNTLGASRGADYYLLARDSLLANPQQTGFSLTRALDPLTRQGAYQVVCWLGTGLERDPTPKPPDAVDPTAKKDQAGTSKPAITTPPNRFRSVEIPSGRDWLQGLTRWPGVTAWLAADRPRQNVDPWVSFTSTLLDGLGNLEEKNNLSSCLRVLQQTPGLKLQGFQAVGGVPPALSLWKTQFAESIRPSRPEMVLQIGHAGLITGLATSADSHRLFTASEDSTLRVWSVKDHALLRVLPGHEVGVNALALSKDGKWLISGGGRSGVLVHAVTQDFAPKIVNRQPHGRRVEQVVPLPDGRRFLSIDQQARSYIWDLNEPALTPRTWLDKVDCLEVAVGGGGSAKEPGVVAARCGDGSVRIFKRDGSPKEVIENPGSVPSALAVSPDGRTLAFGFEDGRVVVRDLATKASTEHTVSRGRVHRLAVSRSGRLAVASERGFDLYPFIEGKPAFDRGEALATWPVAHLVFSEDGGELAACNRNTGALKVWQCEGTEAAAEILNQESALALVATFSGDGRELVVGGKDGSIKMFSLDPKEEELAWERKADRGKIQRLSASPSRRFLAIHNDLNQLQTWDLKDRSCRKLPGRWTSSAFLDDSRLALTVAADASEVPGRLVVLNQESLAIDSTFFARAGEGFKVGEDVAFANVTLSPNGSRIAAVASPEQTPLVCVWDTATGRLTHWSTRIEDPVQSLSFSSDGRFLLTAGDSPEARLWDLTASHGALETPSRTFSDRSSEPITCATIRPGNARQVVAGFRDGRVAVWTWKDGEPRMQLRSFAASGGRTVKAIVFTPDGRYLTVAGDAVDLWVGEIEPTPKRINKLDEAMPHHFEQINTLLAWSAPAHLLTFKFPTLDGSAGLAMLAKPTPIVLSGSDDTTVKFWDLASWNLRATFSSASGDARLAAAGPVDVDWVVYTPQGHFDASGNGRDLVRYRRKDQPRLLDQFEDSLYAFQLGEQIRKGISPVNPPPIEEPPPLAIDPPTRRDPANPDAELTVSLGGADFRDLRIYHNDVPIATGLEDGPDKLPDRVRVPVRLVKGSNRFYAMASRANAFDSRSQDVQIRFEGPRDPGRVHILALGVGDYARRRLSYPERDARRISDVLQRRGIDTTDKKPGMKIVLTNADITQQSVARAFRDLAKQVRKRPQDTVVVFLAGHTGVFDQQKFCLLLNSYPFPEDAPIVVASRDASDLIPSEQLKPEYILPYATIATNMMRLDALNRLVIVDACQAEAIYSDPEVTEIQKWMEIGSRKARTSYLMAARKGEPALEIDPLKHGVFTYTLLRGMRALPDREPKELAKLNLPVDADFDRDGTLTTGELDAYVKQTLPRIASQFPTIVANRRAAESSPMTPTVPATQLGQESRVQAVTASFPLVPIGEAAAAPNP